MGIKRLLLFILAAFCGTPFCACTHLPANTKTPITESVLMTTEANAIGSPQPKLDAEAITLKVLELIRTSKTIADFTPERLTEVTGLPMSFDGPNRYGAGEKITEEWNYTFYVNLSAIDGPLFLLSLDQNHVNSSPPTTDICKVGFIRFSSEMKAMGFHMETTYGEHGIVVNYLFSRNGLTVTASVIGNSDATADKSKNKCVNMIVIK